MFRIAENSDDLIKCFILRGMVFIEEQHCPYAEEIDRFDRLPARSTIHILGEQAGEPVAVGRLRLLAEGAKLERIAIRRRWRGRGIGHRLVDYMLQVARQRGCHRFLMHAQANLVHFYERHGFQARGELFQEAGIDHYLMVRQDP